MRQLAQSDWWISRKRLDAALAHYERDHGCYFVPSESGNIVVGVKVCGVRPGLLPEQLGIRNGDTIAEVNGIATSTADGYLRVRNELRVEKRIVVSLERGGRRLTLSYWSSEPET